LIETTEGYDERRSHVKANAMTDPSPPAGATTAPLGVPVQVAYVVEDVVSAAERWAETQGAGPFFVREHVQVTDVVHRGRPADFDHSTALGQWGGLMLELVQDHGEGPSVVRDLYAPGQGGLHHVAYFVEDLDAETERLAGLGYPLAQSALAHGVTRFHFVDTVAERGHFTELYEPNRHLWGLYQRIAAAAAGWDGRDPVRPLA
jgi:hypothetical protein